MKKERILVTGGTGFVGKNLVRLLEKQKKYKIIILTRKDTIFLESYLKKADFVIHLAYSIGQYKQNIEITKDVIIASKKNKVKKIILLSSMAAKRTSPDSYGINKLQIENMIKNSGLNYTILRPSIIYGKDSKSFDFIFDYLRKIPFFVPIIGNGKYVVMPIHVDDVIKIIEKCITNKKTNKKEYDLTGEDKVYFVSLINLLKKEKNIKKRNLHIPLFIAYIAATIFPFIISRKNIKNLTESSLADISEAKQDLNYKPIKFSKGIKNGLI